MSTNLPEWPTYPIHHSDDVEPYKSNRILRAVMAERDAAIARLKLAQEFIESTSCAQLHHSAKERHLLFEPCPVEGRRDKLLADLLPKESANG